MVAVRRQLVEAGIALEAIPNDWVEATIAAMQKWLTTTRDGSRHAADLLQLQVFRGQDDKNYFLVDRENVVEDKIPADDVWFLNGLVVKGVVTDPKGLRISEGARAPCDGCGIISFCLKNVLDPAVGTLKSYCNFCVTSHESPKVYDQGGESICRNCTVTTCAHHPAKRRLPARAFG